MPGRWETSQVSPPNIMASSFERVPDHSTGQEEPQKPSGMSMETKATKFCRTEYQRGESCTERWLTPARVTLGYSAEY